MLKVGEVLKQERERKGLSLAFVEKKIKVREKFLYQVEAGNWHAFSSKVYVSGIIKNYADLLGLDSQKLLAFFRRDYEKTEELSFRKRISSSYLLPQGKRIINLVIAIIFISFALYFGYQLNLYLSPPKVQLLLPKQTTFKRENSVHIVGKTEKEASISIFGEPVYPNRNGIFTYDFPLKPGKNILLIEVTGANGKKAVFRKEFFLSP